MIVNQHNNPARLGALASAILASFVSFGVNANVSTVSVSPIVVNPFNQTVREICESYNSRIKVANAQLKQLKVSGVESQNTCTYIPLTKGTIGGGQNEVSLAQFKYTIYPASGNFYAQMNEQVDITNELELIMLSGGNQTQYIIYADIGAQLRNQSFSCLGGPLPRACDRAPRYNNSDLPGTPDLVASWNAWGANQLTNVFNNVKTQIQTVDARNNPSVPGGDANSPYWSLDDFSPATSTRNKTLDIYKSTTISFGFDSGTGDGTSLNLGVTNERSYSTNETVMTVHGTELTSDTGSSSEYKLNVEAIWPIASFNTGAHEGASNVADNRIGVSAWRDINIPAFTMWRERVNSENCDPNGGIRNQIFRHTLSMDRGQYDADYNSNVFTTVEDSFATYSAAQNFSVRTKCEQGTSGKLYRVHETGTLNR
ncbi:hypothetical protein Q8W40_19010 [Vibrio penaeicida]|uniref:hypothetical protein n=1 Tax=Vibrio penaeicida TaxID=104609 RepID=UPI00273242FD|nr:hypothetical protein [Vibrio penaeicida]MDP2574288.1 hypothetical protein [Vibrio penaeicida]